MHTMPVRRRRGSALPEEEVRNLLQDKARNPELTNYQLATRYGVHEQTVYRIRTRAKGGLPNERHP